MTIAKGNQLDDKYLVRSAIQEFQESATVINSILVNQIPKILASSQVVVDVLHNGSKVIIFGNGGSAANAQHLAAEMIGRFKSDRVPLPAIALTADTAVLTAIGNDYGFRSIFSRQIEALASPNDLIIAISTSGDSPNVISGVHAGRTKNCRTIALTGHSGGHLSNLVDICITVPSKKVSRIQEGHIAISHTLCYLIDILLNSSKAPNKKVGTHSRLSSSSRHTDR